MQSDIRAALGRNFSMNVLDGGFFGFALGAASFSTVLPLFVDRLTDSALLIALIPAIHTLGWQLPQLLTAQRVARQRRYLPFVLAMTLQERIPFLGLILVALLLPRMTSTLALALTFALLIWQGFGGGFTATAWQSMIAKIIPPARRGLFFGTQAATAALGGTLAASVAGWVLERYPYPLNFALAFTIASGAMAISWLFLAATHEPPHEPEPQPEESGGAYLRRLPSILRHDPPFAWYLLARALMQVGFVGSAFYSVVAVNHYGVSAVMVGVYTSLMLSAQMLTNPLVGWLGDRWGHRRVMAGGAAALGLGALLAWMAPSGAWFIPVFLLTGIANGSYWTPGIAIVLDFAPERERQSYIGLANTLTGPAALLAPLAGGWLADQLGFGSAFLASARGAALTGALLLLRVRDPQRHGPPTLAADAVG